MRTLIIGSGAREHVIATMLAASRRCEQVFAIGAGAGDAGPAEAIRAAPNPIAVTVAVFKRGIDLVILDAAFPGADAIAAAMAASGTACIGAGTFATRAALSRSWTLEFLADNLIPTETFAAFDDPDAAAAYAHRATFPITISTDKPGIGYAPRYCRRPRAAVAAISAATSDEALLIQPASAAPEAVVTFWTDGAHWRPMPHSRGLHRHGPSPTRTWAPAACAPAAEITPGLEQIITDAIIRPFHTAMAARRLGHRGAVTLRLALGPTGPIVLDLYPGLTDTHTPVTLPQLRSDPVELLAAVAAGRLGEAAPEWSAQHLVSLTGSAPAFTTAAPASDARWGRDVAGTAVYDGGVPDRDGRQRLTVVGAGGDFKTARNRAFARAAWIHHDGACTRAAAGADVST